MKNSFSGRLSGIAVSLVFGGCLALSLTGCLRIQGTLPDAVPIPGSGSFRAGAAKVDLTPLPGYPMGGHGPAGKVARGYWTRLYARAFYLEDAEGHPLVLVSCDLWSIPGGLGDRVAELIHEDPDCGHLGREQLVIAATHTHHSPANYSTSAAYNSLAGPKPGFDGVLFELLARRIAEAVTTARRQAVEAQMTYSFEAVSGMSRNRSFPAFLRDGESAGILESNRDGQTSDMNQRGVKLTIPHPVPLYPEPDAALAVFPEVTLVHFRSAEAPVRTIGLATFFAVHPTTMSHSSEVYSGELFGAVAARCEQELGLARAGDVPPPVAALFNGAEGDVSPVWEVQDRVTTQRDAQMLSKTILRMAQTDAPTGTEIDSSVESVRLPLARFMDGGTPRFLAEDASLGAAAPGGAPDGFTTLHELGWKEGVTGTRRDHQGDKQPAFDPQGLDLPEVLSPTHLISELLEAPDRVLIGVHRLGPLALATLPGEFTTVMGKRIRQAVRDRAKFHRPLGLKKPERVILIGLANEYISYVATPEEYEAQYYEGASTLYGPATGPYFIHRLSGLAEHLGEGKPLAERTFCYKPGPGHRFTLSNIGQAPALFDDGLVDLLQDPRTHRPIRATYGCQWDEPESVDLRLPLDPKRQVTPHVSIEVIDATGKPAPLQTLMLTEEMGVETVQQVPVGGIPETDEGLHFVTLALVSSKEGWSRWCTIWLPPEGIKITPSFRFRIETLHGTMLHRPLQ